MKEIRVDPIKKKEVDTLEVYAQVCYHYPAYTVGEVSQLSSKTIRVLLQTAKKQQATHYMNILRIVSAPNSKDKSYIKKLFNEYKADAK